MVVRRNIGNRSRAQIGKRRPFCARQSPARREDRQRARPRALVNSVQPDGQEDILKNITAPDGTDPPPPDDIGASTQPSPLSSQYLLAHTPLPVNTAPKEEYTPPSPTTPPVFVWLVPDTLIGAGVLLSGGEESGPVHAASAYCNPPTNSKARTRIPRVRCVFILIS